MAITASFTHISSSIQPDYVENFVGQRQLMEASLFFSVKILRTGMPNLTGPN